MDLRVQYNHLIFQGYDPDEAKDMLQEILEITLVQMMQNGVSQAELLKLRQQYEQEIEICSLD